MHAFSMLADIANSDHIPPNNPPNPNSVTDTITVDESECLGDELVNMHTKGMCNCLFYCI